MLTSFVLEINRNTLLHHDYSSEPFLTDDDNEKNLAIISKARSPLWILSILILVIYVIITSIISAVFLFKEDWGNGFETELQAAVHAIKVKETKFWGGIRAHQNGTLYMNFDPEDGVRYTGTPSPEIDESWEKISGIFMPMSKQEADSVRGNISEYRGQYYATTAVGYHLHCLNFLRKCLYEEHYPEVHTIRADIPDYWIHIDHCVDTIRQMLQCAGDLTPVPKVFMSPGLLLADTELVHTCRDFENVLEWTDSRRP